QQMGQHTLHAEQGRHRKKDQIERRVFRCIGLRQWIEKWLDEALAVGEQVRAGMVEVRVTLRVEVEPVDEYIRHAQRECPDRDNRKGPAEPPTGPRGVVRRAWRES